MSQPPGDTKPDGIIEHELMQKIASGDADAFAEFYRKYSNLIYSTVYKVLNNLEDSRDVMNEILLKIWKNAEKFSSQRGSLVTWICTTSRNRAIDYLRSAKRRTKLYQDFREEHVAGNEEPIESGWEKILRLDTREELVEALKKLPDNQREVIELIYFNGLTHRQVAERLGRPIGTVKARNQRALKALKTALSVKY